MFTQLFLLFIFFALPTHTHAHPNSGPNTSEQLFLEKLNQRDIIALVTVEDHYDNSSGEQLTREQKLNFKLAGVHRRSCNKILPILSRYEKYDEYLSFIKKSQYDERNKLILFLLDHALIPSPFYLMFKLDRIKTIGNYPFHFDGGIFPGLTGTITIQESSERCRIFIHAHWQGTPTRFPSFILELFSETIAKIGIEALFREADRAHN
ncbi:MAG: hypothetical protein HQK52_17370 [Oligoflexia bacterium]|nr:hypothetical protein [Oligoflexia bacterium]